MTNRRQFLKYSAALTAISVAGPAFAAGHGRIGEFTGASGHVTSGRAEVAVEGGKTVVHLLDDFNFDGAPDPKVALGHDGFDSSTLLGKLKSNSGKQSYEVPAGIDASKMNEVWIWCEKFNVPLGVAKLH